MEAMSDSVSHFAEFLTNHSTSLALGFLVIALYWYGKRASRALHSTFPNLRGPEPWPFLSNLPSLAAEGGQVHLLFDRFYKKYSSEKAIRVSFLGRPSLLIKNPDMFKAIFVKNFDCFYDRPMLATVPSPLDKMLNVLKGEEWKRVRSNFSPNFSAFKLKAMIPLMNAACDTLLGKIEKAASSGQTFDIVKYHSAVSLEIIISCAFGVQSECQTNPEDAVMKKAVAAMNPSPLKAIIGNVLIPMLPGGQSFMATRRGAGLFFDNFFDVCDFIRQVIDSRKRQGVERKDILDMMLKAADSSKGVSTLSEDEIIANAILFLLAGHDTTSITLSMTCHNLATNPDVQDRLQQEIDGVWRDEGEMPSYETVHELPFLEMVISETLRLCPPGFFILRECTKTCEIEGLTIPQGTPILIPVYSIHRDPAFFSNPEKFDPERFSAEAKQSRDPYTFMAFGHGPRNCIGMRFALMEMKMILVRILKRYHLRTTSETVIPAKLLSRQTLGVGHPVNIRVERR